MVKITDPNAPKRPMSGFMLWKNANQARVQKTMPVGYAWKELFTKMGEVWKTTSAEEKKPFEDQAAKAFDKYKKLNNAYKQTTSYKVFQKRKAAANVDKAKKAKFPKDENAPKRPLSGYFLFLDEHRESFKSSNPNIAHKEIVKKLGDKWSAMSDAEKKVFNDKAAVAKKKYDAELEKYKKTAAYKKYTEEKAEFMKNRDAKIKAQKRKLSAGDSEDEKTERAPKKAKKKAKKSSAKKSKSPRNKKSPKNKKSSKKPKAPKASVKKGKKASRKPRKAKKASKKA